jgi:peptidoglycan-associated lipoprotein
MKKHYSTLIWGLAAAAIVGSGCAGTKPVAQVAPVDTTPVAPVVAPREDEAARAAREAEAARRAAEEARMREAEAAARAARTLSAVYFNYDDARIREDQVVTLNAHAQKLQAAPNVKLIVEGHCDERGTIEYNLALGQRRATSARDFLTRAGITADRLSVVSYGEQRPADSGRGESAWSRNRRVEFTPAD